MVPIAQITAARSRCSIASAIYEPMPGKVTVVLPTLIASDATTKNQLPDIDIIMFQMSCGMANGTSRRQKLIHELSRKFRVASSNSIGTVRSD
jgi:hypothetical protein